MRALYPDRYEAFSAGTAATSVSPDAVRVMKEAGIDISSQRSKNLDEFRDHEFDYVVTVCDNAREACPFFPSTDTQLHKSFDNPWDFKGTKKEILEQFRRVRDEIREWIETTFRENSDAETGIPRTTFTH